MSVLPGRRGSSGQSSGCAEPSMEGRSADSCSPMVVIMSAKTMRPLTPSRASPSSTGRQSAVFAVRERTVPSP